MNLKHQLEATQLRVLFKALRSETNMLVWVYGVFLSLWWWLDSVAVL